MSTKQVIRVGEDQASFIINMPCDRTQLLVTVKKTSGGTDQWLSPMGWVDGQKGTLLDCVALGNETCVLIPNDHAAALKTGDIVHVSSFEIDAEAEMKWPAKAKATTAPKPAATEDASEGSGLLGRFGRKSVAAVAAAAPAVKSDIERRAEEASRAAEASRKQMERAQAAQEEAQRRAAEAAELAKQARIAEEQRVAEMEKAQIALAEAEAARKAEQARLEEERRLEEIRIAEEARRAEEARQLELARARQAELRAERDRLGEELSALSARRDSALDRAKTLKRELKSTHDLTASGQAELSKAQSEVASLTDHYSAALTAQKTVQKDVDALQQRRASLRATVEETAKSSERIEARVLKAAAAFEKADRIAKEALAKANAQKDQLTVVQKEQSAAQDLIATSKERDALLTADITKSAARLSDRKSAFIKAQDGLARAKDSKAKAAQRAEQAKANAAALTTNLDQTKAEITAITDRELAINSALTLVDEGSTIEQVRGAAAKAPNVPVFTPVKAKVIKASQASKPDVLAAAPQSIATAKPAPRRRAAAQSRYSPKTNARHSTQPKPNGLIRKLMAGAAAAAVVGVIGYTTLNAPGEKVRDVAKVPSKAVQAKPVKTEVLSAPAITSKPEIGEAVKALDAVPMASETKVPSEPEAAEEVIAPDLEKMSLKKAVAPVPEKAVLETASPVQPFDYQLAFDSFLDAADEGSVVVKDKAKSADVSSEKKLAALPTNIEPQIRIRETKAPKPTPPAVNEEAEPQNGGAYSGVITKVQTDLSALGFYFGPVDGKMSPELTQSMTDYKTLYGLAAGERITGDLLNSLKSSRREADEFAARDALIPAEPIAIQTASITPKVEYLDVTPVATPSVPEVTYAPVEAAPVEVVSITPAPVVPAPALDVIVEAERLNKLTGTYPERAISRGFEDTVVMNFSYDISTDGKPFNIVMSDIDYDGVYRRSFERAGLKSVSDIRFSPKTVNGEPVLSRGNKQRITFRVQ